MNARAVTARWSIAAGALLASALAHAWPSVPLPADSRGEMVSSHMQVNGLDMRASRFTTPQGLEDVQAFYHDAWKGRMVATEFNGATILSHASRTHMITVQLTPRGAVTEGTIGITRVPGRNHDYEMGDGFARPAGTDVASDIRYLDTPTEVRSLAMYNPYPPYVNQQFYLERMRPLGWEIAEADTCRSQSARCFAQLEKPGTGRMTIATRRLSTTLTEIMVLVE